MLIHPAGKFDNSAADNRYIEVAPLAAAMGAEIRGVDVEHITDAQFAEIRGGAVPAQDDLLPRPEAESRRDRKRSACGFGPFAEDAYTKGVPGHPNVQPLIKEAEASARA